MTLLTPLFLQAVTGDTAISFAAQDFRGMVSALSPIQGVTFAADLQVVQRAAGANMSVDIGSGQGSILGDSVTNQGTYLVKSTATVNLGISAAPGSGTRVDLIVAQIYDKQADGGTQYSWTPLVVTGVTGAGQPALPLSAIPLAAVTVAAGTATITNALITDLRILNTLGDVPLWELTGGGGQSVATATGTKYSWTAATTIGAKANPTIGVTIQNPGRYQTTYSTRITSATNAVISLTQTRSGSTIRAVSQACSPVGAVTQMFHCLAGDIIIPQMYQTSGSTLTVDNSLFEAVFSGCWVGP